jgi:hypothetical protein
LFITTERNSFLKAFFPTSALADEGTLIANGTLELDADEGTLVSNDTLDPKALPGLAGPLIVNLCLPDQTNIYCDSGSRA